MTSISTPREDSLLDKCQEKFTKQRQVLISLQKSLSSKTLGGNWANTARRNSGSSVSFSSHTEIQRLNERVEALTKEKATLQEQIKELSNRSNQDDDNNRKDSTFSLKEQWINTNIQPATILASLLPDNSELSGMNEDDMNKICDDFRQRIRAELSALRSQPLDDKVEMQSAADNKTAEEDAAEQQQQPQAQEEQKEEEAPSACRARVGNEEAGSGLALCAASRAGDVDRIKAIVGAGAEIDFLDENGMSALMHGAMEDKPQSVEELLKLGAGANVTNAEGVSALMFASLAGNLGPLSLLIQHGATVTAADDCGAVALMGAAEGGHLPCVEALLRGGAAVNAVDDAGSSAAMLAAAARATEGNAAILSALIAANADLSLQDQDGNTALMLAEKKKKSECADILRAAGATA